MDFNLPEEFCNQYFKAMWSNSSENLFILSVGENDFCYQAMNPACAMLFKVALDDVLGVPLKTFYNPAVYELLRTPFQQCARTAKTIHYEQMFELDEGGYSEWSTTLTPVLGQTGRVSYILGQSRDISEDKQLRRNVQQLRKEADNAQKIKAAFLANISHEMRTPVNGIVGAVEVLLNARDEAEKRHFAEILQTSADGLAQFTNDILDYAKLNTASLTLQHERFSLYEIIDDIALEKQPILHRNRDQLHLKTGAVGEQYYFGDAQRVRQMLAILIDNAIKFTENGDVTVITEIAAVGCDYQVIDIKIRDTGCGISVSHLAEVFKPFKQLDESTTRKHSGLGLGLNICQQLALLMDGDINVSNVPNGGCEFVLSLPLSLDTQRASLKKHELDHRVLKGAKVLLVEDNPVNLMVAERLMLKHGLQVTSVVNGKQALQYCTHNDVDIVVMDWHMPEMDGLEATNRIRQLPQNKAAIPIIGLTANAQFEHTELCGQAGMNDVLTKPVNANLLINKLAHWLLEAS